MISLARRIDRLADVVADRLDAFNHSADPIAGAATDAALQAEVDALLTPVLSRNLEQVRTAFAENNEYVLVEQGLPPEIVDRIRQEVNVAQATCAILHLDLGPISLDVLGLQSI